MPSKRSLKQIRLMLRAQRKEEKAQKKLKEALKGFRPRKAERGKYVFIGTDGTRLAPNSKRKGYLVYVDRKGKREVEAEPAAKSKAKRVAGKFPTPSPVSVRTFHLSGVKHPKAVKSIRPTARKTAIAPTELETTKQEKAKRGGISYDRIHSRVTDKLWNEVRYQVGRATYVIQASFSVKVKGKIESFTFWLEYFHAGRNQRNKGNVSKFVRAALYQFLAEELAKHEYVTAGSAAFIRRMNPGLKVSEWLDRDGNRWEKNEWERVTIHSFDFEILMVQ